MLTDERLHAIRAEDEEDARLELVRPVIRHQLAVEAGGGGGPAGPPDEANTGNQNTP